MGNIKQTIAAILQHQQREKGTSVIPKWTSFCHSYSIIKPESHKSTETANERQSITETNAQMVEHKTKNQEYTRMKGTSSLKFSILLHQSCTLLNTNSALAVTYGSETHTARTATAHNEQCSHAATGSDTNRQQQATANSKQRASS